MSSTLGLGLVLQLSSIALLLAVFGKAMFRRLAPYLVLVAITYHGITELVQLLTGSPSFHRQITSSQSIDRWTVLLGATLMLFSIFYVIFSKASRTSSSETEGDQPAAVERILQLFDWRILAIACLPLFVVAGPQSNGQESIIADPSAIVGLSRQFLALALALTLISFIAPSPNRRFIAIIPALGLVTIVGARLGVLVFVGIVLFGLGMIHRLPQRRKIVVVALIALAFSLSIGTARAHTGRQNFVNASLADRANLIVAGTLLAMNGEALDYTVQQEPIGQRIDGNSFPAAVMDGLQYHGTVGLSTVKNDILLAIPSVLNPSKLSTGLTSRSEKEYIREWYGMMFGGDFLPTQFGSMLAYGGRVGLLGIGAFLGAVFAVVDQRRLSRLTPNTFLFSLGLLGAILDYEGSMDAYTVGLRGVVVILIFVTLVDRYRRRRWPSWKWSTYTRLETAQRDKSH